MATTKPRWILVVALAVLLATGAIGYNWMSSKTLSKLEVVVESHGNGQTSREYTVRPSTDLKHGVERTWTKSGQLKSMLSYRDGKLDGAVSGWFDNGEQAFLGTYSSGQQNGFWIDWHLSGKIKALGNFKDGVKTGEWIYSDENGVPQKKEIYTGSSVRGWLWRNGRWEDAGVVADPH